jgi:hypothetical protein
MATQLDAVANLAVDTQPLAQLRLQEIGRAHV